jgi:Tfp pilus assembly protein PilN
MRAFNLIPPDERDGAGIGAGKSGGGAFVVLGLLGVLAIFALLYGGARHQISNDRGQVATLTAQAQQAQAQAARLAPYVSFMALREQRMQAVEELVDSRFDWAHAFHEFGRVLPKDASLSSLSGTIGSATGAAAPVASSSAAVASSTPPGSIPTFALSGCATSQTEVALTLDRLRLIDGVKEVTLQSSTNGSSSGAGGCVAFAMQVAFEPLTSASATSSTSTPSTASASAVTPTTGLPTTSTGGAR